MGSLFSSNNKKRKTEKSKSIDTSEIENDKDRAILDLKNARDRIQKFVKKVL
jgi:hypothetical protein